MYQDIEVIDCLDSQSNTDQTVNTTDRIPLTAKKLAELLGTTERTVFKYANRLLEAWHWLPESEFRSDGVYTDKALTEMQRLKAIGKSSEYAKAVAIENQKPSTQQTTIKATAAIVPARHTEALETKLATIQQNTTALNVSVQERITTIKQRIVDESNRTKNNQNILSELERQAAVSRGIERGLQLFELQEQAAAATVEQLTLEKLQQQG